METKKRRRLGYLPIESFSHNCISSFLLCISLFCYCFALGVSTLYLFRLLFNYLVPYPHSGLAVHPPPDEGGDRDSVFNMAESAAPEDSGQVRRTITMVRIVRTIL
jgi:hypothetical protein